MPDPVWNCHSFLPLVESNARNSPVCAPVKTRSPAVASTPDQNGTLVGYSQMTLPVSGSIAERYPRLPSAGSTQPPISTPRYQSPPGLYSCLTVLYFQPKFIVLAKARFKRGS